MSSNVATRGVLRAVFTKSYGALQQLMSKDQVDVSEVQARFKVLEDKFTEISELNTKISMELFEGTSPEKFDAVLMAEVEACDEYAAKFYKVQVMVNDLIQPSPTVSDAGVTQKDGAREKRRIKLPELELRPYDGDVSRWISFWAQFSCIDKDGTLSDEEKFQYLIQATSEGSRARALVQSYPPSGNNYSKALADMKELFGRKDLLTEFYVRALLGLVVEKQNMALCELYVSLSTQVKALETLEIVSDQYAALLLPLIESCIPVDLLRVWQRSNTNRKASLKEQMDSLMDFLKNEVEGEQRITMASTEDAFGLPCQSGSTRSSGAGATAADLANISLQEVCAFCEGRHDSTECRKAREMSLQERKACLRKLRVCFGCTKSDHPAWRCKAKCTQCNGRHIPLLCPGTSNSQKSKPSTTTQEADLLAVNHTLSVSACSEVFLQTFSAVLFNGNNQRRVRVLIDCGSQRSYVLSVLAKDLGYDSAGQESLVHSLFGGGSMGMVKHTSYKIHLRSLKNDYACNFTALDQGNIAALIPTASQNKEIQEEAKLRQIQLIEDAEGPVDVLIGADVAGKIWSGNREILPCGVVAVETAFGWTLMGTCKSTAATVNTGLATTFTMATITASDETDLWKLESIGICDPVEKKKRDELRDAALQHFKETVEFVGGRYQVRLPWSEMISELPSNQYLAEKRLEGTIRKLERHDELFREYDNVFKEWIHLNIIEETENDSDGHYLPHRPVVKNSSLTTKVRPVFDASAKSRGAPSLNDCLEAGPNMIELIPDVLTRFRERAIGVSADVEKAFLMIGIHPDDRAYLKFLWKGPEQEKPIVFRHNRVVFGVTCSPFLLAAVLDHHLDLSLEKSPPEHARWLMLLKRGFYVDNLACSVDSLSDVFQLQDVATNTMSEGGFNLRGWEFTKDGQSDTATSLLGLKWDRQRDTLSLNMDWWEKWTKSETLTKRSVYSMAQKIYDPIGFCSPVSVNLKCMIQTLWEQKLDWDDELPKETGQEFDAILQQVNMLREVAVQRCLGGLENRSLHLFCDASAKAYAACIFLRSTDESGKVVVNLIQAKSKIVSLKDCPTMPRLELMGAAIGVRLLKSVQDALGWQDIPVYGWSDSSTVLAWIQRHEEWSVFVRNRVKEIRAHGSHIIWRHVPGNLNPADLPSRGCSVGQLIKSQWWEGPPWLRDDENLWPQSHCTYVEEEVAAERLKSTVSCLSVVDHSWLYRYFSKFEKIVRMVGWIKRFTKNCKLRRNKAEGPPKGPREELTVEELYNAEKVVWRMVQEETFVSVSDRRIRDLCPFLDADGIVRVKTKICERTDSEAFTTPILIPHNHPVVERMARDRHLKMNHAGAQTLWNRLREEYWVLRGRQLTYHIVRRCVTCRRYGCKNFDAESPPLPSTRVSDGSVFEVCGVDYAGPLILRGGEKVWIALFTCGIYRAVHLETVTSLSTEAFLMALRRFIARRGRPKVIYSDNGTCFQGANNAFGAIDWGAIVSYCSVQRIEWKFNPPTASWWGGFFERMVQTVKRILRRILGRASLALEELYTIVCECESLVNSRPITYSSQANSDPLPLTPALFLQDIQTSETPDCDAVDRESLDCRLKYRQSLREQLRERFRLEYLGNLRWSHRKGTREPMVGEIVLIGSEDTKRLDWPLARVLEVFHGNDGTIRVLHLKTARGTLLRPLQRVYPLEIDVVIPPMELEVAVPASPRSEVSLDHFPGGTEDNGTSDEEQDAAEAGCSSEPVPEPPVTRCGRLVKRPQRLDL